MYYLISQGTAGRLCIKSFFTKNQVNIHITAVAEEESPYKFVKDIDDLQPDWENSLLINGDIVVPREKRVVVEYEVE